jgi:two-component system sensor kinase FixL
MFRAYAAQSSKRAAAARITAVSLVLAFGASALPLIGWIVHQPMLAGLGFAELPMWPLTSIGFLCSIVALAGTVRGFRPRVLLPLLLLALGIGAASLLEMKAGIRIGVDDILFREGVRVARANLHGNIGMLSRAMLVLLPIAIALTATRNEVAGRIAAVIASLCLAFGALSLLLVPNADLLAETDLGYLTVSLGSGIAITSLSVAVLARLGEAGWSGVLAIRSPEWKLFEVIFPVILVTPVFVEVFEFLALSNNMLSPVMAQIFGAGLDVAAIAIVLFWATTAVVHQRSVLQELTRAFDAAPIALTRRDGRIIHWSRGCQELYGWTPPEAVGRFKHELLASRPVDPSDPEDTPNYVVDRARALVETTRDGGEVRVIEQVRPVDGFGRTPVLVLSMTDIGARLDAEAALRESQDRLSLALSSHDVGIFEWRAGERNVTWAPGSEERLGLRPGDLSSCARWKALADADDVGETLGRFKRTTSARGERFSFKYRFHQRNGAVRVIDGSARCFYDEQGALVRIVGVNIDVTEREEREAALHAREAQLRSILETVPDAMIVIDERGIIRSFSRTAEQMFGYSAAQAVGMNVSVLTTGEHPANHDDYLKRYIETGVRKVIGRERLLTAIDAAGTEIPVELRVGEAHVGNERLFTGFIRDISERLDAEERLSTLQADLAHASRINAMGEMAAGLAHELNQPLTAVVNYLGTAHYVLKRGGDPAQADTMVEAASEQALRAGEIIRRLREFVAKRETETRCEPIEPAIREAAALVLVGQEQLDLHLTYEFDPEARIMLADRIQVQQVLVNLLRNSVEALRVIPKENRAIRLRTRAVENEMVEISVRDTGPGIPESVLSRMYQPFTSTKGGGGMGIGLSICRRIVQAHGGTLQAENGPDGGACFRFTLPSIGQEELQA